MKSGWRTMLILALVFAVLLIITALQSGVISRSTQQAQDDYPFARVFTTFGEDDILAVRLLDPDNQMSFTIVRTQSGDWSAPDHGGQLDQQSAALIVRTITLLPFDRTLAAPSRDALPSYGFAPSGILLIQIVLADGTEHGVAVGARNPDATAYYGLIDSRSELYLLGRPPIDYLLQQLRTPPIA